METFCKRFICCFLMLYSYLFADPAQTWFPIDPLTRGFYVADVIKTLNKTPYLITNQSEVAMQLQLGTGFVINSGFAPVTASNGLQQNFIPYLQAATASPFDTMVIVQYQPSGVTKPYYLVVPVEKIAGIMYSTSPIQPPLGITSHYPPSVTPICSVDPALRAADLVATYLILTSALYKNSSVLSGVGMFVSVNASYDPPIFPNGFIPNVTGITASGPFLYVQFQPVSSAGLYIKGQGTIVVSAEQVKQLVYVVNKKNMTASGGQ